MKHAGLLFLLFAAGTAGAQPVYKCTGADGNNSYQSTPCADGEVSATRAHASSSLGFAQGVQAPRSGGMQSATEVPAAPGQRRVQVRYTTNGANAACDGARAQRTAALGAAGAAATAELRSNLDRDVKNACG